MNHAIAQIDYRSGIESAWADVAAFVPKLAAALAVFVIGMFVARIIRAGIERLLTAVKFDQWVDKAGLGGSLERAGYRDSGKLLAKLIYWAVLLVSLQLAVQTFGDTAITAALDGIVAFLPKLFVAPGDRGDRRRSGQPSQGACARQRGRPGLRTNRSQGFVRTGVAGRAVRSAQSD